MNTIKKNETLTTWCYARTSGTVNGEESIPMQINIMQSFAEQEGYIIQNELIDEKMSGTTVNRPGYNKLKDLILAGHIDVLLVSYFDRLSRQTEELSTFLVELQAKGIECISVVDKRKLSTMSKIEIIMVSLMAEEENKARTKRIIHAKKNSERAGAFLNRDFLGYNRDKNRKLVVVEEEAEIVRYIFGQYVQGYTVNEIVKHLNSKEKTLSVRAWNMNTIINVLTNKTYTGLNYKKIKNDDGTFQYEPKTKITHEPIISKELFNKVKEELDNQIKEKPKKNRTKHFHLFKGILTCPICSKLMKANSNYYFCNTKSCAVKTVNKSKIEPILLTYIKGHNGKSNNSNSVYQKAQLYTEKINKLMLAKSKIEIQFAKNQIALDAFNQRMFLLSEEIKTNRKMIDYDVYLEDQTTYSELIEKELFAELKNKMEKEGLKLTFQEFNKQYKITEL